jgi:hypothetical protein
MIMTPATEPLSVPDTPIASGASGLRLRDIALAAIARSCLSETNQSSSQESEVLRQVAALVGNNGRSLPEAFRASLRRPHPADVRLVRLGLELQLAPLEILAVALAANVEEEALTGRVLAHVQAPVGGSRPTLGLVAHAFPAALDDETNLLAALLNGSAITTGLLAVLNEAAPLPERSFMVPTPIWFALAGQDSQWPGTTIGLDATLLVPLPESVVAEARRHAMALDGHPGRTLVLRSGSPAEARSVAAEIATALERRPVFIETDKLNGLGPWLSLRGLVPVFSLQLAPGEIRALPNLPGYSGPVLATCGPDGGVESPRGGAASWILPVAPRLERVALWQAALGETELAEKLGAEHRHGTGRIAHLGRLAHHHAALAGRSTPERDDLITAAWTGEGSGLDSLAEPVRSRVCDEALVTTPELAAALETLLARCRLRDDLTAGLGASATTRYRPGVRALFTGPSGTGKTLAAGWIATRLGLPLYRVDLAAVTSKYIGETEKNLSQLLARAEQAEVILFFDEADSLFGKRTDISDSNDRFANAQTNYLLQRIENYDGIVLLTSNSQARFDDAFARRLDFVVAFPPPRPEERRALWQSHLGDNPEISPTELNQLAALVDFSGGHIRNVVFAAAVQARRESRAISLSDLAAGIGIELKKLGRQVPVSLQGPTKNQQTETRE